VHLHRPRHGQQQPAQQQQSAMWVDRPCTCSAGGWS
jgi:hypothetical protein